MTTQTKQADERPAWGNWRKPTPQELEKFKARWKKKHGFEPRAHEIAEFDPDRTILHSLYAGTGQKVPTPNLEEEIAMMQTSITDKIQ
jgi:hypothetical protein